MVAIALPREASRVPGAGVVEWLTTTDHKKIGVLYLYTTFLFFLAGGIFPLLMRTQLAAPNNTFLNPQTYNELMTLHGTTMIFLWIIPVFSGLGNYFVPLMIGARDMAFPRINAFAFWLIPLGGLTMYAGLLTQTGAAAAGWTGYVPLTEKAFSPGLGQDLDRDPARPLHRQRPHRRMPRHHRRVPGLDRRVVAVGWRHLALPRTLREPWPLHLAEHVGQAGIGGLTIRRCAADARVLDRLAHVVLQVHHQRARHLEQEDHDGDDACENAGDDGRLDPGGHPVAPEPGRE